MPAKLCQIVALVGGNSGKKSRSQEAISQINRKIEKSKDGRNPLLEGVVKTFNKTNEEEDWSEPDQRQNVRYTCHQALEEARGVMTEVFNACATQDWANCEAKADIVVDNHTVLEAVPVTHMLWLEKRLEDFHTFVRNLPTLDPAETWTWSPDAGHYVAAARKTVKTKKTPFPFEKSPATEQHPAQVETMYHDVPLGEWETVKLSGAIPAEEKNDMLSRLTKLQDALKAAREEANSVEVESVKTADKLFDFIYTGVDGEQPSE